MDPAYYVAASSLKARSSQLDVLANNLANATTVGYKSEKTFFSVFNKALKDGRGLPHSRYVNDGTVVAQQGLDLQQGPLHQTGRALDAALEGNGYFVVRTPAGERVTRDGRFQIGSNGQLQASDGSPILGKNGQLLTLDPARGSLTISPDGSILQDGTTVGQLDLRAYGNPERLRREGAVRFDPAGLQPAQATATVSQGYLEESGVNVSALMVDMIRINRLFELSMKVASTFANDLDNRSINDVAIGR